MAVSGIDIVRRAQRGDHVFAAAVLPKDPATRPVIGPPLIPKMTDHAAIGVAVERPPMRLPSALESRPTRRAVEFRLSNFASHIRPFRTKDGLKIEPACSVCHRLRRLILCTFREDSAIRRFAVVCGKRSLTAKTGVRVPRERQNYTLKSIFYGYGNLRARRRTSRPRH
jgi:hypothetical protein